MPEIFHVAMLLVCLNGECTTFESAPYAKNISLEQCQNMLRYTFETQAGPYYDKIIDFDVDKPEDIKIIYAGCDKTDRRPEEDNNWRITPNADPELYKNDPNNLIWQQQKGNEI